MRLWLVLYASLLGTALTSSPFEGATYNHEGALVVPLHRGDPPPEHRRLLSRHLAKDKTSTVSPPASTINLELLDQVPLDIGYGTHFAYLLVGTPPQRQTVIVDTGSHFTAFPCTGCKNCGDGAHTDPYYNPADSSTVKICERDRKKADADDRKFYSASSCDISQSYTEGSSWRAKKTMDKVKVGPKLFEDEPNTVDGHPITDFDLDFTFGCQTSETGLFRTQLANGIMGMSNTQDTLVVQMKDKGMIPKRIFSMCFALGQLKKNPAGNGGTMVLGGYDHRIHDAPVQWVPMAPTQSNWFAVEVVDIKVGGVSLGTSSSVYQEGKGMIVDSGTTDTYLPSKVASSFKAKWKDAAGRTYQNKRMTISADQLKQLPVIEIILTNGVTLSIPPTQYIEKDGNGYTPRVYLSERCGGVLGANVMQNFDVIFDAEDHMIGWARSDCKYSHLQEVSQAGEDSIELSTTSPTSLPSRAPTTEPPTTEPPTTEPPTTEPPTARPTTSPTKPLPPTGAPTRPLFNFPKIDGGVHKFPFVPTLKPITITTPEPTVVPTKPPSEEGSNDLTVPDVTVKPASEPTVSPTSEVILPIEERDNLFALVGSVLGGIVAVAFCVGCCVKWCCGKPRDYSVVSSKDTEMPNLEPYSDDNSQEGRPSTYTDDPETISDKTLPRYSDSGDLDESETNMEYLDEDDDAAFSRV